MSMLPFNQDRRMVVKLLVTYFEHNRPREVLELMSKILQFTGTCWGRMDGCEGGQIMMRIQRSCES